MQHGSQSDNLVTVADLDNVPMILSHRLSSLNTPPYEKISGTHFSLQEIIIVGNVCDQVRNSSFFQFIIFSPSPSFPVLHNRNTQKCSIEHDSAFALPEMRSK